MDWSWSGNNLIAFDRVGTDEFFDVYQMTPQGTDIICLTEYPGVVPQKHNGQPAWHPSGNYIVFQAEKDVNFDPNDQHYQDSEFSKPGMGWNCDLWCVDLRDMSFTRLTNLPTRKTFFDTTHTSGVLHPHFSHDGTRLLWSECLNGEADIGDRGNWGQWRLNLSKFVVDTSGPRLDSTIYFERGEFGDGTFYESHGFSPDDSLVIFSGNLQPEQHQGYLDIYTIHVRSHELTRLTFTTEDVWDEHAHYSPNGQNIVRICSEGYAFDPDQWQNTMKTDYWLTDEDGQNGVRLTYFNDPMHPEYTGARVIVADNSWSPEGDKLIACAACFSDTTPFAKIFMIEFAESPISARGFSNSPERFHLLRSYPNPFNAQTVIGYQLPFRANMTLMIFDLLGREVCLLVNETQSPGLHSVIWDGTDKSGTNVGTGIYFCRGESGSSAATTKLVLLR